MNNEQKDLNNGENRRDDDTHERFRRRRNRFAWLATGAGVAILAVSFASGVMTPQSNQLRVPGVQPQNTANRFHLMPSGTAGDGGIVPGSTQQLTLEDAKVIAAVNQIKPAVVGVVNLKRQDSSAWQRNRSLIEEATGSGFVFEKVGNRAQILTNNHVVADADEVDVALNSGERVHARILGKDALTDLAVLEINARSIDAVAQVGNSNQLLVGEPAIAIGSPLGLAFSQSVTLGVVSATQRSIPVDINKDGATDWELEAIQTDAAINPGNSGGPLVDIDGKVVGINSMKISVTGVEGMGFAIPISDAMPIVKQLIEQGHVTRPYMGIAPKDLHDIPKDEQDSLNLPDNINTGVVLVEVTGAPAKNAGLQQYDVIEALDNNPIKQSADLRRYLYKGKKPGDQMNVSFYRGGQLKKTTMRLGKM